MEGLERIVVVLLDYMKVVGIELFVGLLFKDGEIDVDYEKVLEGGLMYGLS